MNSIDPTGKVIVIWLFFLIPYGIYNFYRWIRNSNNTFENHLRPELESYGFKYISSQSYPDKIFEAQEGDSWLNPVGGGFATVVGHMHYQTRKVIFKDKAGNDFEAFASIDIKKGIFLQRVVRLRWKPELKSIQE